MPIRWRLTLFNALAIGAILLLLGVGLHFLLRESLLSGVEKTVESRARIATRELEIDKSPNGTPRVQLGSAEAERLTLDGVFVAVRDRNGRILYESVNLKADAAKHDSVWRDALQEGGPASGTAGLFGEAPDYVYAKPIRPAGAPLVLEASKSYTSLEETIDTIDTAITAAIGIAFLLSIGGAYFLTRTTLRPVDAVVSSAREMSETDLDRRLPVANPRDEIGRLATTINGLLARLQAAFGRLEASLARQEETLARQRRFAADASHEFRTPLTAISGHARMLSDWALEDPEAAREGVNNIKTETDRLRILAEALLTLARGDEGPSLNVESRDLREVAAESVDAARAAADGDVSVGYAPPKHAVKAAFDRDQIRQVASILLDNAVKYTPEGGKVTVRVGDERGDAYLEVSDTGIGISEAQLPSIFERFHRADASRAEGGAGLGLSIALQIAQAHGGTIEADSTLGEGSTFTLVLPHEKPD